MSIDESKPPKGWYDCGGGCDWAPGEGCARHHYSPRPYKDAHRIAREEAAPYVAEALERIAAWVVRDEVSAEHDSAYRWVAAQLLAMARGERPLP